MRVSQASIIISHAVVRECIPGCGRGPTETSVDSMLFPLITFIIGFKVSRPLVKSVSRMCVCLVEPAKPMTLTGTLDARTHQGTDENRILILLSHADYFELYCFLPRLVFHYFSFCQREKNKRRCSKTTRGD